MKSLIITTSLIVLTLAGSAAAQQVRPSAQINPNVSANLPGPVVGKKDVNRLKCRIGTADPKVCARDGLPFIPAQPRK